MKRLRNQFARKFNYSSFQSAYDRSKTGKGRRREIARFSLNLEYNLCQIMDQVKNHTYQPGAYRRFTIYHPKKRDVAALPFPDRIVQQWYIEEFIKPYYVPRFSYHSYACVEKHGTHQAYKAIKKMLQSGDYAVKLDISKFFPSIDKNILWRILSKHIADPEVLRLTEIFIFDTAGDKGIPIGNYTSQFFANIYMNELDQYVKRVLKVKGYIRYMDDFVLVAPNKKEAERLFAACERFVSQKLALTLNPKSRIIKCADGVPFCGFRIFPTHILISQNNKRSFHRMLRKFRRTGDWETFKTSITAWYAHIKHANSYHYQQTAKAKIIAEVNNQLTKGTIMKNTNNNHSITSHCAYHRVFHPDCMDCIEQFYTEEYPYEESDGTVDLSGIPE